MLFVLFLLPELTNTQFSRSCYSCASLELQNKWYLTGLAAQPDTYFYSDCTRRPSQTQSEACSGPCVTIAFENPDETRSTNVASTLYVIRGCHRTLTQTIADRLDGNSSEFCEIDANYRMFNHRGEMATVRMMSKLCSAANCNDYEFGSDGLTAIRCENQTDDNLLNNQPLNCYDCVPSVGSNCHVSKCTKKYCMKQQVKLDGGFQIMKTCSNVNIFGTDNMCQTFDLTTNPGGVAVRNQYTQCFCKDKQFCNSGSQYSRIIPFISAIFVFKFLV